MAFNTKSELRAHKKESHKKQYMCDQAFIFNLRSKQKFKKYIYLNLKLFLVFYIIALSNNQYLNIRFIINEYRHFKPDFSIVKE